MDSVMLAIRNAAKRNIKRRSFLYKLNNSKNINEIT